MAKYFAPSGLTAVDITGARTGVTTSLKRGKDGFFNTDSKMDGKALTQAGLVEASLMGVPTGIGYLCKGCGFNGFFATCGRCGVNNKVEEAEMTKVNNDGCEDCDCGGCEIND